MLYLGTISVLFVMMLAAPAWAQELVVSKDDAPDPVEVGGLLLYTIVVENVGDETANVRLEDELPGSVDFIALDSSQGDCQEVDGRVVVCEFEFLEPDEEAEVQLLVEPQEVGIIENVARVFLEGDSTPVDVATEQTTVLRDEDGGNGGGGGGDGAEAAPEGNHVASEITQEGAQDAESGDVNQSFEVS